MSSEFCIVGSSFSGCLLGWILAKAGRTVTIIDRAVHPRFAIGESSTPLADFLLGRIAEQFELPELMPLNRWGSWQRQYPGLRCGKKRGFSYFGHHSGEPFFESAGHEASLLVAASATDEASDTHWMRSDVDQWICSMALAAGASVVEGVADLTLEERQGRWALRFCVDDVSQELQCDFLIDASGGGGVVGHSLGIDRYDDRLRTRTGALFGHFRNVVGMTSWLQQHDFDVHEDPFDADDAAQHQLLGKQRWAWMLRFSEGTTSVGIVQPTDEWLNLGDTSATQKNWDAILRKYPTLVELMRGASLIGPHNRDGSPQLRFLPRLSRLWSQAAGSSWCMLPSTAGVIDPLHSTGIAHALSGVFRLATTLLNSAEGQQLQLQRYSSDVVDEVLWIDRIVANCYLAAEDSFELFSAVCSLYFVAAIHSERQFASAGEFVDGFLLKECTQLRQIANTLELKLSALVACAEGQRSTPRVRVISWLRQKLEPWNDVGLMAPELHNRIARSIASK